MKFLDRVALNRLISIIANFILGILKIFAPKSVDGIEVPKPRRRIFPWLWRNSDD